LELVVSIFLSGGGNTMKTILYGLVIALMMTGSGYAKVDFKYESCKDIKKRVGKAIEYKEYDRAESLTIVYEVMCNLYKPN